MPSTALELRHLETLLALAECGSLSKAAARLFLTQSALSHQLKALESHFGAALVEKNVRPLRFTAIGQRLLELARAVLPQVAEAGRDVARLAQGHAGPLRIAVPVSYTHLPAINRPLILRATASRSTHGPKTPRTPAAAAARFPGRGPALRHR